MDQSVGTTRETARLLVVSRDAILLRQIASLEQESSWQLEHVSSIWEAMERVQYAVAPTMLLLDMPAGDSDGLHSVRWLRRFRPGLPIVLVGYPEDSGKREEAICMGAWDYLVRPFAEHQLAQAIHHHLSQQGEIDEAYITSEDIEPVSEESFFIGISPVMRKIRGQVALLAQAGVPVLILGERGSGKQTVARLMHQSSVRSGFEFAKVNCAALPPDLLERELFGCGRNQNGLHERAGKLEICEKGTVLLSEITELPMELQVNLVQVLQSKHFMRPGTSVPVSVDVRVLASSTANLERAVSEKKLREDLYYRLSAYTIHVPPLRERKEELPLLLRYFMHQLARYYGLSSRDFSAAVVAACQAHSWPGNLRELEGFVKRYLVVGEQALAFENIRPEIHGQNAHVAGYRSGHFAEGENLSRNGNKQSALNTLGQSVKLAEQNAIAAALEKTGWNRKAAARLLKVSYRTLLYKIEQYQMKAPNAVPANHMELKS
ncbi:MAG TPA: sigma-54 dependent transcriptional regulator [Alloacidobacterium sp.]|nr:sigma-54 dependent transcriptional regulator [Alloacidobacterium sp.]